MRLCCIGLCIGIGLWLASCNVLQPSFPPVIKGDTLELPAECNLVKSASSPASQGVKIPSFKKFDGAYPAGWPDPVKLPADSYIADAGKQGHLTPEKMPILQGPNPDPEMVAKFGSYRSYSFLGVCKGTPEEVHKLFQGYVTDLALDGTVKYVDPRKEFPFLPKAEMMYSPKMWHFADLEIKQVTYPALADLSFFVQDDKSIAGWTFFKLSVDLRG